MKSTKNRTFAFGAILVMCLTALACVNIISEDSDATDTGSAASPLASLTLSAKEMYDLGDGSSVYVAKGGSVSCNYTSQHQSEYYYTFSSVTGGFGLSIDSSHCHLTGTLSGSGTCDLVIQYDCTDGRNDGTYYGTIHIVSVENLRAYGSESSPLGNTTLYANTAYETYDIMYVANGSELIFLEYDNDEEPGFQSYNFGNCNNVPGITHVAWGNDRGTVTTPGTYTFKVYRSIFDDDGTGGFGWVSDGEKTFTVVVVESDYTHTVTYAANGGSGTTASTIVTDSVNGNSNVTLAANGFSKAGYSFVGWKIGNTVYQPGQTVPVGANASVTATAQWSQNTVTATANNLSGVSGLSYSNQVGASANNGGVLSYAVKSCTGGTASVNASGLVTYRAPTVSSTSQYTVTVTVTATFGDGQTMNRDVSFTVTVDPVLSFTNAATSGTLSVKGA